MSKTTRTPEQVETATLAKAEAALVEKHGHKVVEGSARRAPAGSKWGTKVLVTVRTRGLDGLWDGNTREVATSDVWQVSHTEAVTAQLRKQRASDKRAKARAEREAAAPASTEEADALLGL